MPFGILPPAQLPEPGLEHSLDHVERAISTLISQFQDKTLFKKLCTILVRPFQEIEDAFWDLYVLRRLDVAIGVQLDLIGKILGEARGGLTDEDYRSILRIAAKVLFSKGTAGNLIKITQLFLQSNNFAFDEFYPAAMSITVFDSGGLALSLLKKFLRRAKSAGVRLDLVDGTGGLGARFHYGAEGTGVGYGVGTYAGVL